MAPNRSVPGVGERFADRYYDGIGYGVLIYPENMIDGSPEGFACASCVDHTSFLPFPVYNKVTLDQEDNVFELLADGLKVFEYNAGTRASICKAVAEATRFIYFRSGDILAVELSGRKVIDLPENGIGFTGYYCDNKTLDFRIIR